MKNEIKFEIGYDPLVKAVYIKINEGRVAKTVEFAPETFVDLDQKGNLLGIEMLNPGRLTIKKKKHSSLLKKIANKWNAPEVTQLHKVAQDLVKV